MENQDRHLFGEHADRDATRTTEVENGTTLELQAEELTARKDAVETGRVTVGKHVLEHEQTLEVPVTHEEVTIERHPVERRVSDQAIETGADTLRVPVYAERASAEKQAYVYEEVGVGKRTVQDTEQVSDSVRKEVLDVDGTGHVTTE